MSRKATGAIAVLATLVWGMSAAEAQIQIDGFEPSQVRVTDTSAVYQATVTWTGTFKWRLRVFHNGIQKWSNNLQTVNSPGPSVVVSATVNGMDTWGMQVGDTLNFQGYAQVSTTNKDTDNYYVTVSSGSSFLRPGEDRLPTGSDRNAGGLYAAVPRGREEDLA